jgi:hypothetical protein
MKTWQKWTIGIMAGLAIWLALVAGCLFVYAVANVPTVLGATETPAAAAPILTSLPPAWTAAAQFLPTATAEPTATPVPTATPRPERTDMEYRLDILPPLENILTAMEAIQVFSGLIAEDPTTVLNEELVDGWVLAVDLLATSCQTIRRVEPSLGMWAVHVEVLAACDDLDEFGSLTLEFFQTYDVDLLDRASPRMQEAGAHLEAATAAMP